MIKKVIANITPSWKLLRRARQETEGVDGISIKKFSETADKGLREIRKKLKEQAYTFALLQPAQIPKANGKIREILVGTVSDRIVSKAILRTIRSKFKKYFSGADYSLRNELEDLQGIPAAVKKIQEKITGGYVWVFETDIKDFFGSIPKDEILKIIRKEIHDPSVSKLIEGIIRFDVNVHKSTKETGYSDEDGVAQGSSISPLIAAIYLSSFDKKIQEDTDVELIRYVDDLIVLCKTEEKAQEIYGTVAAELKALGLKIHPLDSETEKTRIVCARGRNQRSFTFLGLTFNCCDVDISQKKKEKIVGDFGLLLNDRRKSFTEKREILDRKLDGLIKQYRKPHYNTKDSLISFCNTAEKMLRAHFASEIKNILGYNPFDTGKLNVTQIKKLDRFFGFDFSWRIRQL